MSSSPASHTVELQVLAGGGMANAAKELAARFEKASGHKIVYRFATTPDLIKLMTSGTPFDFVMVPVDAVKDTGARAHLATDTLIDIARVGMGVAVRAGAPKPDISTPDALKQTLLTAQSISTLPASAAGATVLRMFDALGIGDALKAKIKAQQTPPQVVEAVVKGDAEIAVFLANVLVAPGIDLVGPVPAPLQEELVFAAGIAAKTQEREAAQALLEFLTSRPAIDAIRESGMSPGR